MPAKKEIYATPVRIIRPKRTPADLWGSFIGSLIGLAFASWLAMFAAAAVLHDNLGYWQCAIGVSAISSIANCCRGSYDMWSSPSSS